MIRQYAQAIIAVLLIASWGAAGYVGWRASANALLAKQAREEDLMQKVEERAVTGAATAISRIKVTNKTIHNEVQREVRIEPVYADCRHSPDGLRGVNAALTNRPVEATGDRVMPGADSAR